MKHQQPVEEWAACKAPTTKWDAAYGLRRLSKLTGAVQKHHVDVERYMCETFESLLSTQACTDDLPEYIDTEPHEAENCFRGACSVGIDSTQPQDKIYRTAKYWGIQALNMFGYDPQRFLDSGGIAMVRRAKRHESGQVVALKSIRRENGRDMIRAQYSLLLTLRHCNIICPDVLLETPHDTWMSMEFCEDGDVFTYIQTHGTLADAKVQALFVQLLMGVDFLHQSGILHRNLTPSNLLLKNKSTSLKVGGFGQAIYAPGVPLCGKSRQTDMCACGVILYFMSCGHLLSESERIDFERALLSGQNVTFERLPLPLSTLVQQCLSPYTSCLITARALLSDPVLGDIVCATTRST